MKIFVNNEPLNGALDNEKNLGEIFDAMNKWIESQGKFLMNFLVDGKELDKSEMNSIEISSAERFDFYIGEEMDMLRSSLLEFDNYIDKIGNTIFGRDSLTEKESADLVEGIGWMLSIMNSAKILLKLDLTRIKPMGKGKNVQEILDFMEMNSSKLDSFSSIEDYLENLRDLKLFLMDLTGRVSAIDLTTDALVDIVHTYSENMDTLKNEFIKVNENFQSGKDLIASELLSHSITRLNVLLTGLISLKQKNPEFDLDNIKINDQLFSEVNNQLNDSLARTALALEANDIVQAGDILEYELPEILESLVPFLKVIKDKIHSSK
ncbi:MAG: hypothetical protein L6Q54_12105 [Leptospiraceae bacterium]|nr:hypothetical protein [Leptospiraceae bacterium]MCK6381974.1 hypothetical protein [Leptospiraceae bacterium]NUM40312.1 hypothetical protein [Leptospiraceae bacterium]